MNEYKDWTDIRICQAHGTGLDTPIRTINLASHPAPGAVTRDWTGADFVLTFWHKVDRNTPYVQIGAVEIRDAEKHIKVKGKKGNIGRGGTCLIAIPLKDKEAQK